MKNILFTAIILLGIFANAQGTKYNVGDVVENFTVTDIDGNAHTLYDITATGKYVYLDFFFTTCPPCQETTKYFNQLHDKYGCNQGDVYALSVSVVSWDDDERIRQYENQYGGTYEHAPVVSGTAAAGGTALGDLYGIQYAPTYTIIAPDNTLAYNAVWPVYGLGSLENAFPDDFNPQTMPCTLGTADANAERIALYPTVSDGAFTIDMPSKTNAKVEIFDMTGKNVYSSSYQSKSLINLNLKLSSGVYFVKIYADNQKQTTVKKIVIK